MFAALFLIFILAQDVPAYYLVIKSGKLLEVQAEPRFEGKFCYFVLPDGEPGMLPVDAIDRDRTTSYNEDLAEKKRQEIAAQEAASAETTEPEKPKVIEITSSVQIPIYQREVTESEFPAAEEETPRLEGVIGQPKVSNFTKEDAFYISKETVIRLATGYRIECEMLANHPRGISEVSVQMTAHFSGGETETINLEVSPRSIAYRQLATIGFDLTSTNDLLSSEYTLSYTIGAELEESASPTE